SFLQYCNQWWLLCDPTHVAVCAETITAAENCESRFGTQSFLLCYFLPSIRSQEHISPCQYSQRYLHDADILPRGPNVLFLVAVVAVGYHTSRSWSLGSAHSDP